MNPTRGDSEMFDVGLIHDERGWVAVVRGDDFEQKTYGPEIDPAGVLSLIAEDLEERDMARFIAALEARRKAGRS